MAPLCALLEPALWAPRQGLGARRARVLHERVTARARRDISSVNKIRSNLIRCPWERADEWLRRSALLRVSGI